MSVVDRLLRNDPSFTAVTINLFREDDATLTHAFEQNPIITSISLMFGFPRENPGNWPRFFQALATRTNLKEVRLEPISIRIPNTPALPQECIQFLNNSHIKRVVIEEALLGHEIVSFLASQTSVTNLHLIGIGLQADTTSEALASALGRSDSPLRELRLQKLNESILLPILQNLHGCKDLTKLSLGPAIDSYRSDAIPTATRQLLDSPSCSIRLFELLQYSSYSGTFSGLQTIVRAIVSSSTIETVGFSKCRFLSEESAPMFASILRSKLNLTGLIVNDCCFLPGFWGDIKAALRRNFSQLRYLKLSGWVRELGRLSSEPVDTFGTVLQAAASKLEHLSLGVCGAEEHTFFDTLKIRTLIPILPSMKRVKKVDLLITERDIAVKALLLQAIQRNYSLQECNVVFLHIDPFDDHENKLIEFYMNRNKRLAAWAENPSTVPRELWSEALALAAKAGIDTLYCCLVASMQSGDGPETRKRRRESTQRSQDDAEPRKRNRG